MGTKDPEQEEKACLRCCRNVLGKYLQSCKQHSMYEEVKECRKVLDVEERTREVGMKADDRDDEGNDLGPYGLLSYRTNELLTQ